MTAQSSSKNGGHLMSEPDTTIPISTLNPDQKRQFWRYICANRPGVKRFILNDYRAYRREFRAVLQVKRDDVRSALQ